MNKIATHNSGTGEAGKGLLSWLVTPFARCQSKTIAEQYEAGCRMYDLRVRKDENGMYVLAHGLWTSRKRVYDVLEYLNKKAQNEIVHVGVCFEGSTDGEAFTKRVDKWVQKYNNIRWTWCAVKKPHWVNHKVYNGVKYVDAYVNLGTKKPNWLLPVPYLWAKIVGKAKWREDVFTVVDFL